MRLHTNPSRFHQHYARVDVEQRQSLLAFRIQHPPQAWEFDHTIWHYASLGAGETAIVYLPGAAGFYDIWWQQLTAFSHDYRLISISYPAIGSLEGLRSGIYAILQREGIDRFHVVGTSMGGYLAQYLLGTEPGHLISATLSNTFVPTMSILRTASILRLAIKLTPIGWIHALFRRIARHRLVPAGEHDPLLEAYLIEVSHAGLGKLDFLARLSCIVERFKPIQVKHQTIPVLIIDSDNDPLIRAQIRKALREMYPLARRHTFARAGHFPYLNQPEAYTAALRSFLRSVR